jgi:hypothetical protein
MDLFAWLRRNRLIAVAVLLIAVPWAALEYRHFLKSTTTAGVRTYCATGGWRFTCLLRTDAAAMYTGSVYQVHTLVDLLTVRKVHSSEPTFHCALNAPDFTVAVVSQGLVATATGKILGVSCSYMVTPKTTGDLLIVTNDLPGADQAASLVIPVHPPLTAVVTGISTTLGIIVALTSLFGKTTKSEHTDATSRLLAQIRKRSRRRSNS